MPENNGDGSRWTVVKNWGINVYHRINDFIKSAKGKRIGKVFGYIIQVGIIIYLLLELTQIGWVNFFKALPTTPYFYLLFLVLYGALPIAEIFCYKQSWNIGFWESLPTFIKKRVYNKTVLGYSGEIAVFGWARKKEIASDKEIFKVIRDNNITSSVASSIVVYGLLLFFIASKKIAIFDYLNSAYDTVTIVTVGIVMLVLAGTAYKYRAYWYSMPAKIALTIFSIHATRMILLNVVQVLQWYVVMPEVALNVWFTFLSVQLLVSRIPFLPSRDLFSIGASLEVSSLINVSSAGIAGILVAHSVLYKLTNLALFSLITMLERKREASLENYQEPQTPVS